MTRIEYVVDFITEVKSIVDSKGLPIVHVLESSSA